MRLRLALPLVLVLSAVGVAPASGAARPRLVAAVDAPFAAAGTGSVRFEARGEALVSSAIVRPGTVRFRPGTGGAFSLQCLQPGRPARTCARMLRGGDGLRWQVLRPVRFLYEGADFGITVRSEPGFRLLVLGSGDVVLRGRGRWSMDTRAQSYDGVARLRLP